LPTILKATIPIGAAWNIGFPYSACIASSWICAYVFKTVKVFLDPAIPSTFKRRGEVKVPLSLLLYWETIRSYSFLCSVFKVVGDKLITTS
jgi:hypothetical protein